MSQLQSELCKFRTRFFVFIIALSGIATVNAAISVGPSGVGPLTFDATPPASEWSTLSVGAASGTVTTTDGFDTSIQQRTAGAITTVLGTSATVPPSANAIARRNTANNYLQTRPTGNDYCVLMATLQNDTGGDVGTLTVSYDYGIDPAGNAEELLGQRAYYSLTGEANSWQLIPELSGVNTAGPLSVTLTFIWPANGTMYLLWADDNANGTDNAYTIDNFSIASTPGTITPITITNQPQSLTVTEPRSVTFTVGASGSPRAYFWRKNGAFITGARNPTYTIPSTTIADSGTYSVIVSNAMGAVTSSNATLAVLRDTSGPTVLSAIGNVAGDQITLTFSEPLDPGTGAENSNYEVFLTAGGGDLLVSLASLTNGSNVIITLDPSTPRNPGENYSIRVSNVSDQFGNVSVPNPLVQPIRPDVILIGFDTDNVWKFNVGTDLTGSGWEARAYDDSAWPAGEAGLGLDSSANGVPIRTTVAYTAQSEPVYFRKHFSISNTNGVRLSIRDVVEDGAIYYINGEEAFRHNVGTGVVTFASRAAGTQTDPTPIQGPFTLPTTNLVAGDNVMAVVVLQSGATSTDIELAVELTANIPAFSGATAPTIDTQPQNVTVNQGLPTSFTVGASGTPPLTYQWRKGGVAISGANGATYSIAPAQVGDAGTYSVAVSNAQGGVISANATLTVNSDTVAPTVVAVSGNLNLTNFTVSFSERVGASASNAANYQVTLAAGGGALTVVSAVVAANGTNVTLTTSGPRTASQEYNITVTGVSDLSGNVVTPNPAVQSIGSDVILIAFDASWKYLVGVTNDPTTDLTSAGWQAPGYNDSAWLAGPAGLGVDASTNGVPIRTPIAYLSNSVPVYFRTHFTLSSATGVTLTLRDIVEDGAIYYLNGQEAFRHNVAATSAVNFATRASNQTDPTPIQGPFSLPTTNLVVGDNVLAVQVVQSGNTSSDIELAAELSAHLSSGSTNQPPPGPRINIIYNANDTVTLTWNAPGYRLQEAAALGTSGSTTWSNSTRVSGTAFTPTGNRLYRLISP